MSEDQEGDDLPEKRQEDLDGSTPNKDWDRPSEEKLDREDEREVHRSTKSRKNKNTFFY
jgi:hypothetical protein